MIPKTHTVLPFLLAMLVAVAGMPTNVFQVCRKAVGTLEIEPWLERSSSAIARAVSSATSWMIRLLQLRAPAACAAAVLLALMVADLSAGHDTLVAMAIVPVIGSVESLQAQRATLMAEVNAFRGADNSFGENLASATAKMDQIEALDAQIRAAKVEPTPTPAVAASADAAIAAERTRAAGVVEIVTRAGLKTDDAAAIIKTNPSLDQARAAVLDKLAAEGEKTPTRSQIGMGEDEQDKFARGAQAWMLQRSGTAGTVAKFQKTDKVESPGEFRGMTLLDLAKECLRKAGVDTRGMDRMQIAGAALSHRSNYQTPSDFTTLLENTMHKVLRAAYGLTPDTWSRFCAVGSASDFRTHNWYRTGALSELDSLNDVGEFKNKSIPDGEKATYSVGTKGNIIAISRQTIVNDDLGAVMQLTQRLGRAGKLTIEKMVYALLAENNNLGPTYGAAPLFDATHGNISTGAALSAAAIDADRVTMAQQMDVNSQEYTDLRPAILLVPVGLGGTARIINTSQYDPDTVANKAQMKPNVVAGLFQDVIDTPRISGTRRYLFADPSIAPVIMVSFLEGQQEPVLETENGWRVDGVEMKARLDVGVNAVDYRGAVTNAGA